MHDRHEPRLQADDEHGVELEALGAVEAEQLDCVAGRGPGVVAGAQRGLQELEESRERSVPTVGGEVVAAEAADRLDVLAAFLGHVGGAVGQGLQLAGERHAGLFTRPLAERVQRDRLGPVEESPAAAPGTGRLGCSASSNSADGRSSGRAPR